MTRFWWVRHGPTHAKTMVGWTDLPADLSDHARIKRLSDYLPQNAVVVSSDLIRATATADALAPSRQRLPHDADLRELNFGDWEMKHHTQIEAEDPHRIRAFWDQPGDVRPPGGETWNEAAARVSRATDRLAENHPDSDIIVVAHFGAILSQLQRTLDISAYDVFANRVDNLSVTEIRLGTGWQVGKINHSP